MFKKMLLWYRLYKNSYKWFKTDKNIINEYRQTTNKNGELDNFSIHMKLVRSLHSGHIDSIRDNKMIVSYGYLSLEVDLDNSRIIKIHNSKEDNRNGHIDFDVKKEITSIYKSVFGEMWI
jgi:hypothetical protein